MDTTLTERMLAYIERTDQALQLAQHLINHQVKKAEEAEQAASTLAQRLVDLKFIRPHEKKAAQDQLSDHPGALSILHNLLTQTEKYREKAASSSRLEPGRAVAGARPEGRPRLEPVERRSYSRADELWARRMSSYS